MSRWTHHRSFRRLRFTNTIITCFGSHGLLSQHYCLSTVLHLLHLWSRLWVIDAGNVCKISNLHPITTDIFGPTAVSIDQFLFINRLTQLSEWTYEDHSETHAEFRMRLQLRIRDHHLFTRIYEVFNYNSCLSLYDCNIRPTEQRTTVI